MDGLVEGLKRETTPPPLLNVTSNCPGKRLGEGSYRWTYSEARVKTAYNSLFLININNLVLPQRCIDERIFFPFRIS
jgi:hypothetical protein